MNIDKPPANLKSSRSHISSAGISILNGSIIITEILVRNLLLKTELSRQCLTPAFSGAVNGIADNHKKRASRPPLQRLVRPFCGLDYSASGLSINHGTSV